MLVMGALLAYCVAANESSAQGQSSRLRPLDQTHFVPSLDDVHPQNWCVLRAANGLLFVCNGSGILEYDGADWRLLRTPTHSVVRSLAESPDGRIYGGASGDIGFLQSSPAGQLEWRSLLDHVPVEDRNFSDVWNTFAHGDDIVFVARTHLLIWDGVRINTIASDTGFHTAFLLNGRLILREFDVGLVELRDGAISDVLGGEFYGNKRVYSIEDFWGGDWLISTREHGLFRYDGIVSRPFAEDLMPTLLASKVYHGTLVADTLAALATLSGGLLVVDRRGGLLEQFSVQNRLPDNVINFVASDDEGGIWLALNNGGVVRTEVLAGLQEVDFFGDRIGTVYDLAVNGDTLILATGSGVYSVPLSSTDPLTNEHTVGVLAWSIERIGERFVAAAEGGLLDGATGELYPIGDTYQLLSMGPDSVLVGGEAGLHLAISRDGAITIDKVFDHMQPIRDVTRDAGGDYWISDQAGSVFRLLGTAATGFAIADSATFNGDQPRGRLLFSERPTDLPQIVTPTGLFRQNPLVPGPTVAFDRDTSFAAEEANPIVSLSVDGFGQSWLIRKRDVLVQGEPGNWTPYSALSFPRETVGSIYFDNGKVWLSSGSSLYRFDPSKYRNLAPEHPPLVRNISTIGADSTFFHGHTAPSVAAPRLAYANNDIQFKYSAPIYYGQDHVEYQYRLDGRDADWSDWTKTTIAEYTNLREGDYTFRVRAKNIYGFSSPEGQFALSVLPPWYRTWWAYLFYVAGCAAVAAFSMRYYRMTVAHRRAKEQEKELAAERIFSDKLRHANDKLKTANNRLIEVNNLKDEFLATTSHELRTPITAIQGYAAILREELDQPQREFAEIIDKSSQRLMRTLNSVLDLAKLRSGAIDLHPSVVLLNEFVQQTVESSSEMAQSKNLRLDLEIPDEPIHVECDQYLLRNSILNILDNSVKFSDEGTITVRLGQNETGAEISIADQGVGIEEEFLPHIFDEFKQESDGLAREHGGTGLGLAITGLMIKELDGTIDVVSQKGEGTVVCITIPLALNYGVAAGPPLDRASDRPPSSRDRPADPSAHLGSPA